MSSAPANRRFDEDKKAAGKALDALRLRFMRAGFACHQRAAKDMTVKAYLAPGLRRPLINPRLGAVIGSDAAQATLELEIIVYPDDIAALGRALRPFAERHHLTYEQLPDSSTSWPGGVLACSLHVRSDGHMESASGTALDDLLRELHAALTPSGLES